MNWNSAGDWLMSHTGGGSFHGPAPYTPDGPCCPACGAPEGVIYDCPPDDTDYEEYLRAVDRRC